MAFLNDEQKALAQEIASLLTARGETVCVAEATTGGLTSAALLWVAGASRYYAGGGVVYTLNSRTVVAGVDPARYANYQGTTPEMIAELARVDAAAAGRDLVHRRIRARGADVRALRRASGQDRRSASRGP